MIFTTIVFLEASVFVIWLVYKIAGLIRKHKILSSIIVIGIAYFLIFGNSNNVVNTNSQKNNNLANAAHGDDIIADNSISSSSLYSSSSDPSSSDPSTSVESQSVLYPGDNYHDTGADGHKITLHNNETAINPTYQQMVNFIKSDKTDEIPYDYSNFANTDFAERVHNNAEAAGYKCAWVDLCFINGGAAHACNAFNTVDRGLVFVDCTNYGNPDNDKTVDLKVGMGYRPEGIGDLHCIYYSMGIVKNYQIYW
jgi:hypothetical protein